nr:hypothetical protein [uncultured Bacteroides sp.]
MELEGIISLSLSIFASIGAIYTYIVHTRKLNIQQQQINNYQLKRELEEINEKKKASIEAQVYKAANNWKIEIRNKGKNTATNIRLISEDISNDSSVYLLVPDNFLPYPSLLPQGSFDLSVMLANGHKNIHRIKLMWDDDFSKDRTQEQDISF